MTGKPEADAQGQGQGQGRPAPRSVLRTRVMRGFTRAVLLIVVPILAGAVGLYFYAKGGRYVVTENAYIKARIVAVSADIDGRVTAVGIGDNADVAAGQVLFRIDAEPFEVKLADANARLDIVETEIESLRADHHRATVEAGEARERVRFLERQFQRQRAIREKGLGSQESFDRAEHDHAMSTLR